VVDVYSGKSMKPTISAIDSPVAPRNVAFSLMAAAALALVAVVYWPVHQADFVWDDKVFIHDNAWLSAGSDWQKTVLHGFADWNNYFRPLGMALWVAEARGFGITPGPMHLVSLLLHLANTLIVGVLALRLCPPLAPGKNPKMLACVVMLMYGLHAALIEPVTWLACQFDLLVTLFMLLGLLLNLIERSVAMRALLVAACFFIAACAKESAVAFPVLLVLFDWVRPDTTPSALSNRDRFRALVRRQWPIYLSVLAAGFGYLLFRHWALAKFVQPLVHQPFFSWQRFQTVCFTYMVLWRTIIWPFVGLAPEHIVPASGFDIISPVSLAIDIAALIIGFTGLLLTWRRKRLGILILGVTAMLFPVLRVIPIDFDESLFHERYTMPAIAICCILLPGFFADRATSPNRVRLASPLLVGTVLLWLLIATINIRITVPLWSTDLRMWQWAARENPDAVFVQGNLLSAYLSDNDLARATNVAEILMAKGQSCPSCMVNVADLALLKGDTKLATAALKNADKAMLGTVPPPTVIIDYVLINGNLHQLEHDDAGAEAAFRDAISLDPQRPDGHMCLAVLLERQGKQADANAELNKTLALTAPDAIASRRAQFREALAAKTRFSPHP
jgi:hypothetical protein